MNDSEIQTMLKNLIDNGEMPENIAQQLLELLGGKSETAITRARNILGNLLASKSLEWNLESPDDTLEWNPAILQQSKSQKPAQHKTITKQTDDNPLWNTTTRILMGDY